MRCWRQTHRLFDFNDPPKSHTTHTLPFWHFWKERGTWNWASIQGQFTDVSNSLWTAVLTCPLSVSPVCRTKGTWASTVAFIKAVITVLKGIIVKGESGGYRVYSDKRWAKRNKQTNKAKKRNCSVLSIYLHSECVPTAPVIHFSWHWSSIFSHLSNLHCSTCIKL